MPLYNLTLSYTWQLSNKSLTTHIKLIIGLTFSDKTASSGLPDGLFSNQK
jgi:hypothetical protein